MIRAIALGTLALALVFVSLFFNAPSFAAGLHPRGNIDWPCATSSKVSDIMAFRISDQSQCELALASNVARNEIFD